MTLKKKTLLLIVGFVWLAAGINILRIGIASLTSVLGEQSTLQSVGVLLLSVMILPAFFFAFFYTGLGMALSISGIRFIIRFFALR